MDTESPPTIGHNSGTPLPLVRIDLEALRTGLTERYAPQRARVEELERGRQAMVAKYGATGFPDDEVAGRAGDWISKQVRDLLKELDGSFALEKADPLAAGRAVDGFFAMRDVLKNCVKDVEVLNTRWLKEKDRREKEVLAAQARARQAEAEKLAAQAAIQGNTALMDAAVQAEQDAADMATRAQSVAPVSAAKVRGDFGSTSSLVTTWGYEVDDLSKVPANYLLLNESLVKAAIRTAPKKDGVPQIAIPGLRIVAEQKGRTR